MGKSQGIEAIWVKDDLDIGVQRDMEWSMCRVLLSVSKIRYL